MKTDSEEEVFRWFRTNTERVVRRKIIIIRRARKFVRKWSRRSDYFHKRYKRVVVDVRRSLKSRKLRRDETRSRGGGYFFAPEHNDGNRTLGIREIIFLTRKRIGRK